MKIEPLKQYEEPRFPTCEVLEDHPELLAALPERWRLCPVVLATLAGSCLIMAGLGCSAKSAPGTKKHQNPKLHQPEPVVMGKMAIAMPVLSEIESRKIVVNEAKKHGLFFSPTNKKVKLTFPLPAKDQKSGQKSAELVFELDGIDDQHHVAYEVVSSTDAEGLAQKYPWFSDLAGYGSSDAATAIKSQLKKQKGDHYLVVASPECYSGKDVEKQLRKQVKDFIKWLKAEGVI